MVVERRARRHSKDLIEKLLDQSSNGLKKVNGQVKVRSKVKIAGFHSGCSWVPSTWRNDLQFTHDASNILPKVIVGEKWTCYSKVKVRSGHKRSRWLKKGIEACDTCFMGYFSFPSHGWCSFYHLRQGQVRSSLKVRPFKVKFHDWTWRH